MGGIGISLGIEPVAPPAGKQRSTSRALHRALNKSIRTYIKRRCKGPWLRQTAGHYLDKEIAAGYKEGLFTWSSSELTWGFRDHSGSCGASSHVCYHWYAMCLTALRPRYDKMAAVRGWRITADPASPDLRLVSNRFPIARMDRRAMCIPAFVLGELRWENQWTGPFWDLGAHRPRISNMSEGARRNALFAAVTGRCMSKVCTSLVGGKVSTRSVKRYEKAWLRTRDEGLQQACLRAARELANSEWTAKDEPVGAHGEVCKLLADCKMRPLDVAGFCFRVATRLGHKL